MSIVTASDWQTPGSIIRDERTVNSGELSSSSSTNKGRAVTAVTECPRCNKAEMTGTQRLGLAVWYVAWPSPAMSL